MCVDISTLSANQLNLNVALFIPIGSIEVHGPTLPIGTDTYIAMAFAQKFAEKVEGVTFPPIFVGLCPNTNHFKGTVSVTHASFVTYIAELCKSLVSQGVREIILVNIHNGNDAALKIVVESVFDENGYPLYYLNPYTCEKEQLDLLFFNGLDNSYKEAALLFASLQILGLDEVQLNLLELIEDQQSSRPGELNILRKYGYVGFAYEQEAQHIAGRKNVNVNLGLQYIDTVTETIPDILASLSKHMERSKKTDKRK
jgi:creatinine amidohydrolase/Fe(II)-dependent formamide hydrolase-like protein